MHFVSFSLFCLNMIPGELILYLEEFFFLHGTVYSPFVFDTFLPRKKNLHNKTSNFLAMFGNKSLSLISLEKEVMLPST